MRPAGLRLMRRPWRVEGAVVDSSFVPVYPVNLVVSGRRCVVVGGGSVAARKAEALAAAGAELVVVAPRVSTAIRSLPAVTVVEREYEGGDLEGAWLAVAATDDPEVNRRVHAEGEAARVWVNAVDDPPACSFTLPAVVRQGPVVVAVSTSGHSPALAAWIREKVAEQLGPEVALLAEEGQGGDGVGEPAGWPKATHCEVDLARHVQRVVVLEAAERIHLHG